MLRGRDICLRKVFNSARWLVLLSFSSCARPPMFRYGIVCNGGRSGIAGNCRATPVDSLTLADDTLAAPSYNDEQRIQQWLAQQQQRKRNSMTKFILQRKKIEFF